ncbi:hypothetical protein FBY40_0888 [Microbacterium sp. SLBN-154]|uniref:hypothetical protein n=1 Tax=Microbacterium sp. SLBN-154 TaxID=2768458 RepID=UPI001153CA0A|nr:hypothetical protein [Microbacterium sp. SLBN-154]TQK18401.1 hypothetical protein FBY40_0888 [Microbacterium sp. SLBN-154]
MVTLLLDSTRLEVALSVTERALSFRRGNVLIERSAITKVQLTDDPWTWLRGAASPGTFVPGMVAMGTFTHSDGADFVIVRRRRPGVVIDLDGHPEYARVVLTTRHGVALAQALRLDTDATPTDVVDIIAATGPIETITPKQKPRRRPSPSPAPAPSPASAR